MEVRHGNVLHANARQNLYQPPRLPPSAQPCGAKPQILTQKKIQIISSINSTH